MHDRSHQRLASLRKTEQFDPSLTPNAIRKISKSFASRVSSEPSHGTTLQYYRTTLQRETEEQKKSPAPHRPIKQRQEAANQSSPVPVDRWHKKSFVCKKQNERTANKPCWQHTADYHKKNSIRKKLHSVSKRTK